MKRLLLALCVVLLVAAPAAAADHWDMVSGGLYYTMAIKSDGTLWAWGANTYGQLGDGTRTDRPTPVQIGIGRTWVFVGTAFYHTFGIKADGTLWAWGYCGNGALGTGDTGDTVQTYPKQVGVGTTWTAATGGWHHSLGLTSDGKLWAWGSNQYGQVGNGSSEDQLTPVQIGTDTNWAEIATGGWHSLARKSTGALYGWGVNHFAHLEGHDNQDGMVGDGTTTQRSTPVQVGAAITWAKIAAAYTSSAGISSDGKLYTWGASHVGELGQGNTTTSYLEPTQVGAATTWATIAMKNGTGHATQTDGTLWGWGSNTYGSVGDGTTTPRLTPIQIGALTTWATPARGHYHCMALKSDGTLFLWGYNSVGQLGDGTTTNRSTPTEVVAPPITYVVAPSGGDYTTIKACLNVAQPGETCLVYPGTYGETRITTTMAGTAEKRITLRAQGDVTVTKGFTVNHPYHTIEGFTISGWTTTITDAFTIAAGAHYTYILNNTINGDADYPTYGVHFSMGSSASGATNCLVRGNQISGMKKPFISLAGDDQLIEYNTFLNQNDDFFQVWGTGHTLRRNVMAASPSVPSNHPDWFQIYANVSAGGTESASITVEENFVEDLDNSQLNMMNYGDLFSTYTNPGDGWQTDIKDWTIRRNVIANVSDNSNLAVPNTHLENNSFYRAPYVGGTSGAINASAARGMGTDTTVQNNLFLACGNTPTSSDSTNGWYTVGDSTMSYEAIGVYCTGQTATTSPTFADPAGTAYLIQEDLQSKGWLNSNHQITASARALSSIDDFTLDATYNAYKTCLYTLLTWTVTTEATYKASLVLDYNYVGGAPTSGYPTKRKSSCGTPLTPYNFCETHGINGGNVGLIDYTTPRGADGLPFTLDDGLKPSSGSSILCGTGAAGVDIGAYDCDADKVFVGGAAVPAAATGVTATTYGGALLLQWTHIGTGVTEFIAFVDAERMYGFGLPTPSGTTYSTYFPNLTAGAHTLVVMACNTGGCTPSSAIQVVKM